MPHVTPVHRSEWSMVVYPDDDGYTAECRELGTVSSGDTEQEALENLRDAIDLHLATLIEEGLLEEFLAERGLAVAKEWQTRITYDDVPANDSVEWPTIEVDADGESVILPDSGSSLPESKYVVVQ